jgi:hypothetical protein
VSGQINVRSTTFILFSLNMCLFLVYLYCDMTAESGILDPGKISITRQLPVNTSAIPGPSLATIRNSSRGILGSGVFCAVRAQII